MRRIVIAIGLQAYALVLAYMQSQGGLRTDEAKYLLNIPYPHPPLLRWIMSLTEVVPAQGMLWRVISATLLVQLVWLVWDMSKKHSWLPSALWLLAPALALQGGSVMMVVFTAAQALVFVWLLHKPELVNRLAGWVALFWLASLFTAYQVILFGPVVALLFYRAKFSWLERIAYVCVPVALLVLYTAVTPSAIANIVIHSQREADVTLMHRMGVIWNLWILGGGGVLTVLGIAGMLLRKRWELVASLLLVSAYVGFSHYDYYALLFTPLFIAGVVSMPSLLRWPVPTAVLALLCGGYIAHAHMPPLHADASRTVMQAAVNTDDPRYILINGDFGHQWQYESTAPVLRYRQMLVDDAQVVLCLETCVEMGGEEGWSSQVIEGVEVWKSE